MAENDTDRNEPCDPDIDDTAAAPAYRMSRGRVALLAVLAILPGRVDRARPTVSAG